MEFHGLTLSDFQIQAIDSIKSDKHCLVSTHTGNGKTLVADFAVDMDMANGDRVIYTAPIKALSNQKYRQFKKNFGEVNVGLITGDRVINEHASILVMTTEILRNMMHEDPHKVDDIKHVIFDEIHYLNDEERGTVWEESIIFMPQETNIIGLSATIPNFNEICDWIEQIHGKEVERVCYPNRIIPLKHFYYDKRYGPCKKADLANHPADDFVSITTDHVDLVEYLKKEDILPALFFVFSRKQCEAKAYELSKYFDFLNEKEKEEISKVIKEKEEEYPTLKNTRSWRNIQSSIENGICFHHAGLLPIMKEIIEELFEKKLIKVLYTTETFAVGINFPVRTVCFDSHRKWDGKEFRNLKGSEYLQMAGRAGRRGIDDFGYVFSLVDYGDPSLNPAALPDLDTVQSDPIISQFKLGYNTVSNLYSSYSREQVSEIIQKSFAVFQFKNNAEDRKTQYEADKQSFNSIIEASKKACRHFSSNRCPAVHQENKHTLYSLKRAMHTNISLPEKEQLLKQIDSLNFWFKKSPQPIKCKRTKTSECQNKLRANNALDINLKELERSIYRDPERAFNKDYDKKIRLLENLGYINKDGLTARGEVCSKLHVQELLVTELIFDGLFHDVDEDKLNAFMAGIILEDTKLKESFIGHDFNYSRIDKIVKDLQRSEALANLDVSSTFIKSACPTVYEWSRGCNLQYIATNHPDLSEGDFVALCRRITDLYRQIKNAVADDPVLISKINRCIDKINRDVVALGL